MKNLIEELRNGERDPQDTPVDNNLHYKKLQHLQSRNKAAMPIGETEGKARKILRHHA